MTWNWDYILLPIIGALIGWFTNFLAVKMIFHPRKPIKFLWFTFQGVLPKRKSALAKTVAETIEKELISHDDLQEILLNPEFQQSFKNTLEEKVETFLNRKARSLHPLLAKIVTPEFIDNVKNMVMERLERFIPDLIAQLSREVEDKIDFKRIVIDKIEGFEIDKMEEIAFRIAERELKHIEIFGGVIGFFIGVVQMMIVVFIGA